MTKSYDLTKCKGVRDELITLRDTYGLTWAEILAEFPKYKIIPLPTLSMIYHGERKVPKKYAQAFGEPVEKKAPACTRCGEVHTVDRACVMNVRVTKPQRPRRRKWRDISTKDLREALENRHAPRW